MEKLYRYVDARGVTAKLDELIKSTRPNITASAARAPTI